MRAAWLWLRGQGLRWPLQKVAYTRRGSGIPEITWVEPTYHAVHTTLTHPAYAGAYVYGRTRKERYLDPGGALRQRSRRLPRDQREVLIPDHHPGFTGWDTYQANQARISTNIRPRASHPGTGAVREGSALLRAWPPAANAAASWPSSTPARRNASDYYCQGSAELVGGRGSRHMSTGGQAIDAAVTAAFLAALAPAALDACLQAARQLEDGHDAALAQHQRQVEQARYHAARAERRYRAVDPDNRLVARGLETEWEQALRELADAEAALTRRQTTGPRTLTPAERAAILALGADLGAVWDAPTTTAKDRKQLLRTLLDEVNITLHRDDSEPYASLVLRWKGGAISELTVLLRRRQPKIRTDEDTVDLIRRLAVHYPNAVIAGILNRQHRTTACGMSSTASSSNHCATTGTSPAISPATTRPPKENRST